MKKLIIFDFDGTLVDTSEGLIDTHAHIYPDKIALKAANILLSRFLNILCQRK